MSASLTMSLPNGRPVALVLHAACARTLVRRAAAAVRRYAAQRGVACVAVNYSVRKV